MRKDPRVDFRFEHLEARYLLSANDCLACGNDLPKNTEPTALFAQASSVVDDAGNSASVPGTNGLATPFGIAQTIELEAGTQAITGETGPAPIVPFHFAIDESTELSISNAPSSDVGFSVYTVQQDVVTHASNGSAELTLESGEYLLYVYDIAARPTTFELEITLPATGLIEEFPEVPYIGRDFDWNLNLVNAPEVWAQGFTGEGTLVAVVDTGVDYRHPDLDDNIYVNPGEIAGDGIDNDGNGFVDDVHGWDFTTFDNDPSDINGHGTHVAGTIAAERNGFGTTGVAYDATILPVKVLGDNGSGSPNAIAAGIRYAVDVGADVINLSLGGGVTRALVNALRYAWSNDVIVVAASGNDAASSPGAPAIYSSVLSNTLSVGAHDRAGVRSSFSNRVGSSGSVQIDAPGSRIASTAPGGGYRFLSGTSMAAPHVAGVAALAYSANPDVSAADLRTLLVGGANRTVRGSDSVGGVNAARTVALAYQFDLLATNDTANASPGSVNVVSASSARAFSIDVQGIALAAAVSEAFESENEATRDEANATEHAARPISEMIALQQHAEAVDAFFA